MYDCTELVVNCSFEIKGKTLLSVRCYLIDLINCDKFNRADKYEFNDIDKPLITDRVERMSMLILYCVCGRCMRKLHCLENV